MDSTVRQLRLASCVETIIGLHTSLSGLQVDPALSRKFKRLENSLKSLADSGISERDVLKVEEATNRLLSELKLIFEGEKTPPMYSGTLQ